MKVKFWEADNGNQSGGRLIFLLGSIWNMALMTYVAVLAQPIMLVASAWASIQAVLGAYILIHKNIEITNKDLKNEDTNS
jgi:hypothetical protein